MASVNEPGVENAVSGTVPAMDLLANPRPRPQLYGTKPADVSIFASTGIGGGTTGNAVVAFRRSLGVTGVAESTAIGDHVFIANLDRSLVPDLDALFDQFIQYRFSSITVDLQAVATITASGAIQVGYNPDPGNPTAAATTDIQRTHNVDKLIALAASKTVSARGNTQIQPMSGIEANGSNDFKVDMTNVVSDGWKYCKPDGYPRAEKFGEIFSVVRAPAVAGSSARFVMTVVGTLEFRGTTRNAALTAVNTYSTSSFIDFTTLTFSSIDGDALLYFPTTSLSKLVIKPGDIITFCQPINIFVEAYDEFNVKRFFSTNASSLPVHQLSIDGAPIRLGLAILGLTMGIDFALDLTKTTVRVDPIPKYVITRQVIPSKFANLMPLDVVNEIRGLSVN